MSVPLARRQLVARPGRAVAGFAGIAVALLLVLALLAIFAGMQERLTALVRREGHHRPRGCTSGEHESSELRPRPGRGRGRGRASGRPYPET